MIQAAGIGAILLNQSTFMIYVFLTLFGIGTGGVMLPRVMMESHYFGRKAFGTLDGTANMIHAPFGLVTPVYAGWIFDTTNSYTTAFIVVGITGTVGAILCCLATPPKKPAVISSVEKFV